MTRRVTRLHTGMYAALRARSGLPSQRACRVERQGAAPDKGRWTNVKKKAEHRRTKMTRKHLKGLDKPPKDSSPTVQSTSERDDTPTAHMQHRACMGDAKRWDDQRKKPCSLLVSCEIEGAEPTPHHLSEVVGGDVGIRSSSRDCSVNRHSHRFSGETETTPSQPFCTTTPTLAAERHSWRETPDEAHRAAREKVERSGEALHGHTDHHAAPTFPDRPGKPDRSPRAHQAQATHAQEERQRD